MKKNYQVSWFWANKSRIFRTLLIMKITIFLCCLSVVQGFALDSYAQKTKLALNFEDISLKEALTEIEKSSEFYFLYNSNIIDINRTINFEVKSENIYRTLKKLFRGTNVTYTVVDRQIVLSNKSISSVLYSSEQEAFPVSGKVTDTKGNPMMYATVAVKGTTTGAVTTEAGTYTLPALETGTYTLVVSYAGYATSTQTIVVTGPLENINFELTEDLLNLDEVVVTGTSNPKSNLESSVAITSLNADLIETLAPTSAADLMQAVPGFLVENSGGEVGNNLFARGIPSAGAYEFVSIQEDGLPVFEDGALQFSNVDNYLRIDETLERVEALRGGSGSVYASNAPGGIINFISKTGGDEFAGISKVTVGTYGLYRADLNIGGPISENLFFNIGGFYRYDNGVRNPGFPANKGGQIKANITYKKDNNYVRLYYKKLDDRNLFLLPIPLKNPTKPEGIEGFDPNYGTYASKHISKLKVPQLGGGYFERDLENGVHPIVDAVGGEAFVDLGKGWSIKNSFRITNISLNYNAIFTVATPTTPGDFAANTSDYVFGNVPSITNPVYTYADDGTAANPNLVVPVGFWAIDKDMRNFADRLELNYAHEKHSLTFGLYHSNYTSNQKWNWSRLLVEATDDARLLNLTDGDKNPDDLNYSRTQNGVLAISWLTRDAQTQGNINSIYLNEEFYASDKFTIDAGVRLEIAAYQGYKSNSVSGSLGDTTTTADDFMTQTEGPFTYWKYGDNQDEDPDDDLIVRPAFSVGVNYKFNDRSAAYVRVSNSFRSPIEEAYYDNIGNFAAIKPVTVTQAELGYKLSSRNVGFFANFFAMDMDNLAFTDILASGESENLFAGAFNYGLELETNVRYGIVGANLTGTIQNPRLKDFTGTQEVMNDNRVRRIPNFFMKLRPYIEPMEGLQVYVQMDYFGSKFNDNENSFELPAFFVLGAGASFEKQQFLISLNGENLTNTIGLTEGDPRVGGAPDAIYNARPILGARAKLSVAYKF